MTTGPKPANATELLESQLLVDFIERALEEYDHVIFDSGPMMVVSETPALAPRVDGVVTVVRARSNSRGLLARMKENLRQLKAENLGARPSQRRPFASAADTTARNIRGPTTNTRTAKRPDRRFRIIQLTNLRRPHSLTDRRFCLRLLSTA